MTLRPSLFCLLNSARSALYSKPYLFPPLECFRNHPKAFEKCVPLPPRDAHILALCAQHILYPIPKGGVYARSKVLMRQALGYPQFLHCSTHAIPAVDSPPM